jgi:hypothetical protein
MKTTIISSFTFFAKAEKSKHHEVAAKLKTAFQLS